MPRFLFLTLYPEMFPGPLGHSLAGRALEKGLWSFETLNIRDFAEDRHKTVDDRPYGGGAGMVMKPDIIAKALDAAIEELPDALRLYPSPRGELFTQRHAAEWQERDVVFLCGRFEGVDERVIKHYQLLEVSLGDFVLSGGEMAALAMLDSIIRLLPGVMGNSGSADEESFSPTSDGVTEWKDFAGLLEYPHYTRPPFWQGMEVPDVLTSGNHEAVRHWRLQQAKALTQSRRPDLWKKYNDNASN